MKVGYDPGPGPAAQSLTEMDGQEASNRLGKLITPISGLGVEFFELALKAAAHRKHKEKGDWAILDMRSFTKGRKLKNGNSFIGFIFDWAGSGLGLGGESL